MIHTKLLEAMLLREFIFSHGDPVQTMLDLNVFADLDEDGMEFNDADPDFVEEWQQTSAPLRKRIESMPRIPLLPTMIDRLEQEHYDGSDAYEEGFEEDLGRIYGRQLRVCKEICDQIDEIVKDPNKAKDMILRSLLTAIKGNTGSPVLSHSMMKTISALRDQGYDYPELVSIEKSLKAMG